jgi:hypothetical protein
VGYTARKLYKVELRVCSKLTSERLKSLRADEGHERQRIKELFAHNLPDLSAS